MDDDSFHGVGGFELVERIVDIVTAIGIYAGDLHDCIEGSGAHTLGDKVSVKTVNERVSLGIITKEGLFGRDVRLFPGLEKRRVCNRSAP